MSDKRKTTERERAKRVILEIIRLAGGTFTNKTNLYKAFYYAHLEYAKNNPAYLSFWPIVKMPNGPGIDDFDALIGELLAQGYLHVETVKTGDFSALRLELTSAAKSLEQMSDAEMEAVGYGVRQVEGKTATLVSDESHVASRSWNEAQMGQELNIYIDSIPEDEYVREKAHISDLSRRLKALWN